MRRERVVEGGNRRLGTVTPARWSTVLLLASLCGCFQTKDELTLEADGSGHVRIETRTSIPAELLGSIGVRMEGMGGGIIYPPITEADAKKFFPGRDFTVTVKEDKTGESERGLIVEAAFKDVNALLASPYGRAHALTLRLEDGKLTLKALAGLEAAARFSEMKDSGGMFGAQVPGLAEMQKKKDDMRSEFRVTLPNLVAAANGRHEGTTVTWLAERAKFTNATEFAQKLGTVLEASCSTDGLKMKPVTPARLGLFPFKELQAGAASDKDAAPGAKEVAAAAKFVPYALQVTRSLDLSGEGGSHENQAQLFGAVVLPKELAPQKWGEAKLEEVLDAKGNNLKPEEGRGFFGRGRYTGMAEEESDDNKPAGPAEERRPVTLQFQPPDWKVKEIARIKGSMSLQYLGTSQHVVKLTNAVPAKWIKDVSRGMAEDLDFDASQKPLSDSMLPELGLSLSFQTGMAQSGFTMLMLQVGGQKAVLSDAQVFDAEGRPWPTFVQQQSFGEQGSCSLVVAGQPTAPLSLAVLASGVGATVEVPILLEHVPVGGNTAK